MRYSITQIIRDPSDPLKLLLASLDFDGVADLSQSGALRAGYKSS
ncbi:MAG TPA: hypothetical protein VKA34_19825 [Balneolales bacterium]|nr:hypothetical protein [Balneolales bacterium]